MKRTETFQNLLVMMMADGKIHPSEKAFIDSLSYQLGITDDEYDQLMKSALTLDYVIPGNRDDAFNELTKMIFLSLADNEISEEEEKELRYFSAKAGFTDEEFEGVLNYVLEKRNAQFEQAIAENKLRYDEVMNLLRTCGKTDAELATTFHNVIQSRDLNFEFSKNVELNLAFYCWLWLVYARYCNINKSGAVMSMMSIDLIKAGQYTLEDMFIDLKLSEELAEDGMFLHPMKTPLETVKAVLSQGYPFNQ
jgi:hypothetical protein